MADTKSQTVILREGALDELESILDRRAVARILLIADKAAYRASGAESRLASTLAARQTLRFSKFEENPKLADGERGVRLFHELRPEMVVGLGGGTAIDMAKLIAILACQHAPASEVIAGDVPIAACTVPIVAIPTTAGTGSEATHFAVVYRDGNKYSVAHPSILPDVAIVDPLLTHSMPRSVTAATGLDAFCQAVESVWSVGATEQSLDFATRALALARDNLDAAVGDPTPTARRAMCEAAHLAGKAINITKTTAPHALSYWLTMHRGIPHGTAVALFLGPLLAYNAAVGGDDCNDPRGPQQVRARIATILEILDVKDAAGGHKKIENLIRALGSPSSLRDIGIIGRPAVMHLIQQANAERLNNNPRRIDASRLVELLSDTEQLSRSR
jgi:alcohol dehydrogenase class IV